MCIEVAVPDRNMHEQCCDNSTTSCIVKGSRPRFQDVELVCHSNVGMVSAGSASDLVPRILRAPSGLAILRADWA